MFLKKKYSMSINDFSLDVKDGILIVTSKKGVTKDEMFEVKSLFESGSSHIYNYVMYSDGLGYYHAYDFINNQFIYCTTINRKYALELVKKYKKNAEIKNSGNK